MRRSYRNTGPSSDVVDAILERDGHACRRCRVGLSGERGVDYHLHHRRPRRLGGSRDPLTNSPANLAALCPPCHDDVESERAAATWHGWLISQSAQDPATVPLLVDHGSRWIYLTHDAQVSDNPPTDGVA